MLASKLAAQLEPCGGTLPTSKKPLRQSLRWTLAPPHPVVHSSLQLETSREKASTGAAPLRWVMIWWSSFCSMLLLAMSYLPDV